MNETASKIAAMAKPSTPPEFYIFIVVLGFVACWGLYWYFRRNTDADKRTGENGANLQQDDRERLVRIEEIIKGFKEEYRQEVKELRAAFHSLVRDRGEQAAQIGEIKGELQALIREIGR